MGYSPLSFRIQFLELSYLELYISNTRLLLTSLGWLTKMDLTSRVLKQLTSPSELSVGHPTAIAILCAFDIIPSVSKNIGISADPLSAMAAWNSPVLSGDSTWK
jgi:ascorbate-specific PTS system EIIC-type component UlaA